MSQFGSDLRVWRRMEVLSTALRPPVTFSLPLVVEPSAARRTLPSHVAGLARAYARAHERPQYAPGHGEGDFEILRCLGASEHTVVYRARQLTLNRPILLKIYHGDLADYAAAGLPEHEHLTRVYAEAFDPTRRLRFVARQFVAGVSLAQLARSLAGRRLSTGADLLRAVEESSDSPLSFHPAFAREREALANSRLDEAIARMALALADALDFAHLHGVAHGNLKASNIIIDGYGHPYLTDFAPRPGPRPREAGLYWAAAPPELDEHLAREAFDREQGREDVRRLWDVLLRFHDAHVVPVPKARTRRHTIVERELVDAAPETHASAAAWRSRLRAFLELRALGEQLPPLGFWMRQAARWPLASLVLMRQLPHLAGTIICTAYCTMRPGLPLNTEQRAVMRHLLRVYSSFSYPLGITLVLLLAWGLARRYRGLGQNRQESGNAAERQRVLRLPWRLALINTGTWLPSIGVFTFVSYRLTGRFNPSGFTHFALAVILAYLIATAYSTLYACFVCIRVLYPRFLEPRADLRALAREELRVLHGLLRWLPLVMAAIPLTAAMLLVHDGPGELQPERLRLIQGFLLTLIVAGAGGFLFALSAINRLVTSVRVLGQK